MGLSLRHCPNGQAITPGWMSSVMWAIRLRVARWPYTSRVSWRSIYDEKSYTLSTAVEALRLTKKYFPTVRLVGDLPIPGLFWSIYSAIPTCETMMVRGMTGAVYLMHWLSSLSDLSADSTVCNLFWDWRLQRLAPKICSAVSCRFGKIRETTGSLPLKALVR